MNTEVVSLPPGLPSPRSHSLLCYLNGDVSDEVSPQAELSLTSSAIYHCLPHTPGSCSLTCSSSPHPSDCVPLLTWREHVPSSPGSSLLRTQLTGTLSSPAGQVSLLWARVFGRALSPLAWLVLGPTQLMGPGRHFRSTKPAGTGQQGGVRTVQTWRNPSSQLKRSHSAGWRGVARIHRRTVQKRSSWPR